MKHNKNMGKQLAGGAPFHSCPTLLARSPAREGGVVQTSVHPDTVVSFTTSRFLPVEGHKGGYVNPKTGRSYHIDENNRFGEKPHVDVNRSKTYKGDLDKKKYPL